jgi:hypothetical protein
VVIMHLPKKCEALSSKKKKKQLAAEASASRQSSEEWKNLSPKGRWVSVMMW